MIEILFLLCAFALGWALCCAPSKQKEGDIYSAGYERGFCDGRLDEANRKAEPITVKPRDLPGDFQCPPTVKLSEVVKNAKDDSPPVGG